jgi:hypothetical protein
VDPRQGRAHHQWLALLLRPISRRRTSFHISTSAARLDLSLGPVAVIWPATLVIEAGSIHGGRSVDATPETEIGEEAFGGRCRGRRPRRCLIRQIRSAQIPWGGNPMGSPSLLDPIPRPVTVPIRFPNRPSLGLVWVRFGFGFGTLSLGATQLPRINISNAGGGA